MISRDDVVAAVVCVLLGLSLIVWAYQYAS